ASRSNAPRAGLFAVRPLYANIRAIGRTHQVAGQGCCNRIAPKHLRSPRASPRGPNPSPAAGAVSSREQARRVHLLGSSVARFLRSSFAVSERRGPGPALGGPAPYADQRSRCRRLALLLDAHLERRVLLHAAARCPHRDLVVLNKLGVGGGLQRQLGFLGIL